MHYQQGNENRRTPVIVCVSRGIREMRATLGWAVQCSQLIVHVSAPVLSLVSSNEENMFTAGSSIILTCVHLNTSILNMVTTTTHLPWQPGDTFSLSLLSLLSLLNIITIIITITTIITIIIHYQVLLYLRHFLRTRCSGPGTRRSSLWETGKGIIFSA